jgi:hypothetical protein
MAAKNRSNTRLGRRNRVPGAGAASIYNRESGQSASRIVAQPHSSDAR